MNHVTGLLQSFRDPKLQVIGSAAAFVLVAGLAIYVSPVPHPFSPPPSANAAPAAEAAPLAAAEPVPAVVRIKAVNAAPAMSPLNAITSTDQGSDLRAARPSDRSSLTRALQADLARAQCYDGPVNSLWTTQTKEAMRRFTLAVNAQLPVSEPDDILLALLESNSGAKCPAGDVAAAAHTPSPAHVIADRLAPAVPIPGPQVTLVEPRKAAAVSPMIERIWARADLLVPAIKTTAAAAVVAPVTMTPDEPKRPAKAEPRAPNLPPEAQRRLRPFNPKPAPFAGVGKSITKGVKSLQRSIASIFN